MIAVCPFLGLDCMKIRRSSSMARRPALGFDHYWAVHNITVLAPESVRFNVFFFVINSSSHAVCSSMLRTT
jgi:hypothetical protein